MAFTIPAGGIVEVVIQQSLAEQTILNVLHYKAQGTSSDGKAAIIELIDIIRAAGGNSVCEKLAQCQSNLVSNVAVTGQLIYPTRYLKVAKNNANPSGDIEAEPLPPNVAAVVTKKAEIAGRHGRGNIHVAGCPTNAVDAGKWTDNQMLKLLALGDALVLTATGTAITWLPVLIQRAALGSSVQFIECEPMRTVRIMRRRTVGLGI